jgi:hypothetical protein
MAKYSYIPVACVVFALAGCATATDVMDMGGGVYMISARAAPARGGAAGATQVAYKDAQAFCAAKGTKPIVVAANDRDVMQGSVGGSFGPNGGNFGGGVFAAGNATLRFRCE